MEICLSMWSIHKYWYDKLWRQKEFIDFAASAGVENVELLDMFWGNGADELTLLEDALAQSGVRVGCYSTSNDFVRIIREERNSQLEKVKIAVDRAKYFDAKVVRVFSGNLNKDVSESQALEWILAGLTAASDYAGENGITLCLENHGYFAGKAEQVLSIVEAVNSPALKVTFDTGNFLLVDDDPMTALKVLKSHIQHVHLKDFIEVPHYYEGAGYTAMTGKRFVGQVPGDGVVDLHGIVEKLQSYGYNGLLAIEYEGNEEQKQGSLESVRRLKEILQTRSV